MMRIWNRKKKNSELNKVSKWQQEGKYFFTKTLKNETILMGLSILVVLIIIMGSSYAVFSSLNGSEDYNKITVGNLDMLYDDTSEGYGQVLNLTSEYPVSDEVGMNEGGYKFAISNSGNLKQFYSIRIAVDQSVVDADNCADNLINFDNLRVSVNDETPITLGTLKDYNYVIYTGIALPSEKNEFTIKMWININAGNEVLGKHFHGKVVVEAENTTAKDENSYLTYDTTLNDATVNGVLPIGLDLSRIDIPNKYNDFNVTGISSDAFNNCGNLKVLYIPNTIKSISDNIFTTCTNLTDVYIDNTSNKITVSPNAFLDSVTLHYES